MRAIDEPIPDAERLFRTFSASHYENNRVLPGAIDPDGTSVDREKYRANPAACLTPKRPDEKGVAFTTRGSLPGEVPVPGGISWLFYVIDYPEEGNEAHAEIRVRRANEAGQPCGVPGDRPKKPAQRTAIKSALADVMTVVIPPT
jgi:hypothetical protein